MAQVSSGSITTGSTNNTCFYVDWQVVESSSITNKTKVNWQVGVKASTTAYWYNNAIRINNVKLNGTEVKGSQTYSNINLTSGNNFKYELASGQIEIPHESDGTKKFKVSISGWLYPNYNASAEQEFELPKIDRGSIITTTSSYPYTLGTSIQIATTKYLNNAIDKLEIKYNNTILFSSDDYVSNTILNPIESALTSILNSTSEVISKQIDLVVTLKTYIDDVQIGEASSITIKGTLSQDIVLNSLQLIDINAKTLALTGDNTKIVKGLSTLQITPNYELQNGGVLKLFEANNIQYTSSPIVINNYDQETLKFKAISKREYEASCNYSLSSEGKWINYQRPTINGTVARNTQVDGKVNISVQGTWFNGNFSSNNANTLRVFYRSKLTADSNWSSWTEINVTKNGNNFSGSVQKSNYNYQQSYNFQIAVVDKYYDDYSIYKSADIMKGEDLYSIGEYDIDFNIDVRLKGQSILRYEIVDEW